MFTWNISLHRHRCYWPYHFSLWHQLLHMSIPMAVSANHTAATFPEAWDFCQEINSLWNCLRKTPCQTKHQNVNIFRKQGEETVLIWMQVQSMIADIFVYIWVYEITIERHVIFKVIMSPQTRNCLSTSGCEVISKWNHFYFLSWIRLVTATLRQSVQMEIPLAAAVSKILFRN